LSSGDLVVVRIPGLDGKFEKSKKGLNVILEKSSEVNY